MRKPKPEPEYWTAQQAAAHLGLAAPTIYNGGAGTNQIPRVKLGRSVRWKRIDVIAFSDRQHGLAEDRLRFRERRAG